MAQSAGRRASCGHLARGGGSAAQEPLPVIVEEEEEAEAEVEEEGPQAEGVSTMSFSQEWEDPAWLGGDHGAELYVAEAIWQVNPAWLPLPFSQEMWWSP